MLALEPLHGLVVLDEIQRRPEFKYSSTPSVTRSMRVAITDLKLDHLYVVYPGSERFPLATDITAIGLLDAMETWSSISEHE